MTLEIGTSVIIPTFNRPQWAAELVTQLVAQRGYGGGLEVLLVNDNGDPAVFARARAAVAGSSVELRCFDTGYEGFGAALARNVGIAHARYIVSLFLDDDVMAPPGLVSRHQSTAEACLRLGRIDSLLATETGDEVVEDRRNLLRGHDGLVDDNLFEAMGLLHGGHFSMPTPLARKLGGFDVEFLDEEEEDTDFGARAIMAVKKLYILASARVFHRGLDSYTLRERGLPGGTDLPRRVGERFMERKQIAVNGGEDYFRGERWQQYQR
jgi:glycosyltransferase involved in cell wall biosynthesis